MPNVQEDHEESWVERLRSIAHDAGRDDEVDEIINELNHGQAEAWQVGFDTGTEAGGRWFENGGADNDDVNPYDHSIQ
jgi:hypothetical protein